MQFHTILSLLGIPLDAIAVSTLRVAYMGQTSPKTPGLSVDSCVHSVWVVRGGICVSGMAVASSAAPVLRSPQLYSQRDYRKDCVLHARSDRRIRRLMPVVVCPRADVRANHFQSLVGPLKLCQSLAYSQ